MHAGLKTHTDLRDKLINTDTVEEAIDVARQMQERRADISPEEKLGWYYRYWPSMNIIKEQNPTFTTKNWDEHIAADPLFNKKGKNKKQSEV
jgi:hypothetical protein